MKNTSLLLGLIAGSALLISSAQAQNIVTNGDFESGIVGSTATGWTSVSTGDFGDPWVRADSQFAEIGAYEGSNFLQLRGNFNGTPTGAAYLEQSLTTIGSTTYDLDFALGTIRGTAVTIDGLSVLVTVTSDGGTLGDLFNETITSTSLTQNVWETFAYNFTTGASDTTAVLRFTENSTNTYQMDPLLDAVSVSVIPEPGTYALLAGLTGLVSVMVRRRR